MTAESDRRDALEQELWELEFGCHEEPDALRARIDADAGLRALHAEVRAAAALLRDAARVDVPPLAVPAGAAPTSAPRAGPTARERWRAVGRRWAMFAAAALLIALPFVVSWGWHEYRLARQQRSDLHVVVSGPRGAGTGAGYAFTIEARDGTGAPGAVHDVAWRALDDHGAELARGHVDVAGTARVTVPASLARVARVSVSAPGVAGGDRLELATVGASAPPFVHIDTDRPLVRPGETLRSRIVVLDRTTLTPDRGIRVVLARLADPRGATVAERRLAVDAETGVAPFTWQLATDAAGGRYTIDCRASDAPTVLASATVLVRSYARDRLAKRVTLDRDTYAPGERGAAEIAVERLGDGGPAAGAQLDAELWVDGTRFSATTERLGDDGRATVRFAVPDDVERGAARLVARITDGGLVETAVQPFVVPTGRIDVRAWPEGGALLAGEENRIYVEVRDPLGRGVAASGALLDAGGERIATVATAGPGLARVAFTPRAGERYELRIDAPTIARIALPATEPDAVLLRSLHDLQPGGAPLSMRVAAARGERLLVAAFCRGQLVGQATVEGAGPHDVAIPLDDRITGVLRVTVFDAAMHPRAERLVRRALDRPLAVDVVAEAATVAPGGTQRVRVVARDADGAPVPGAVLGIAVTDLAPWTRADAERVGLADDVALFADAPRPTDLRPLLAGGADADRRADLLLGTLGWRRYLWASDTVPAGLDDGLVATALLDAPLAMPQSADSEAALARRHAEARAAARRAEERLTDVLLALLVVLVLASITELTLAWTRAMGLPMALRIATVPCALLVVAMVVMATTANVLSSASWPGEDAAVSLAAGAVEPRAETGVATTADRPPAGDTGVDATARLRIVREAERAERIAAGLVAFDDEDDLLVQGRLVQWPAGYLHAGDGDPATRDDFTETVCWQPALRTDAAGLAEVGFTIGEQVTTWRIDVDAHAAGHLGGATAHFASALPLRVEAVVPPELTAGDRLLLPVAVEDRGDDATVELRCATAGALRLAAPGDAQVALQDGRGRALVALDAVATGDAAAAGSIEIGVRAATGLSDVARHTLAVLPRGFPHARSRAGTLGDEPQTVPLAVPGDARGVLARLRLFPSPLAQLEQGLDGMLQEPHGCFEQTSSTSYPNTLVLAFLDATGTVAPATERRARELLDAGYRRLVGFECPHRGYEWFGHDPGHQSLSAYGLLQFHDLRAVHAIVDDDMLARTRGYVLATRDGTGGFSAEAGGFHSFGAAPDAVRNAYATYALLYTGEPAGELRAELDAVETHAGLTGDAYELGIAACALQLGGRAEPARAACIRLAALQESDGSLQGRTTSITGSLRLDLRVETTSFAVLAWLGDPTGAHHDAALRAVRWLGDVRRGSGTFGATQATIQALRALTAWARQSPSGAVQGEVVVRDAANREVARLRYAAADPHPLEVDLRPALGADGTATLTLSRDGSGELPWVVDLRYHAEQPADDPDAPLALRTYLPARASEGEVVALRALVTNLTGAALPMTCASLGLPAGLEARSNVLDDLVAQGTIAAWETRGRDVVLYWRGLAPDAAVELALECVARFPGRTAGPASRAWLYYAPDAQRWAPPLAIDVAPAR
ncbi:MAG: hypothetical protein IPM29_24335 [Planctomycetes bacterium]|nr:hypothetical protein [Planctomycetota bacterium]